MHEKMLAARRILGVHARMTLPTGIARDLTGEDILNFTVEEGAQSALLPGSVLSARLTMELRNDEGQWRNVPLTGATVQPVLLCEESELPCGVYIIDSVSALERGGVIRLGGSDSIASGLSGAFVDALVYPATLQQVWQHWLSRAGCAWNGVIPNGGAVIPNSPEWGSATLRKAAGWIAQAAGCFIRLSRTGMLEMLPCVGGEENPLDPSAYWDLEDGFQSWGPIAAVKVKRGSEEFTVGNGAGETVSVDGNPLLQTEEIALGMLAQIQGLRLEKCGFRWRGEPDVGAGSMIALTDTYGKTIRCIVTRQTMKFDGGFSAQIACDVPDSGGGGVVRAITPEGGLNAGALVGEIDGKLLAAESVTAQSIAAQSVTAQKLAAGAVTADKLDAQTVSAQTAKFVAARMSQLTAQEIASDALYAAFAHVISLAADSIAAGTVEADRLAAALAEVVSLNAKLGEFDFATVQNLVAKAMSLEQGAMDTVYIKNLAVNQANLLSATLGKLVIKGEDGKYYRLFIGSDGKISVEEAAGEGIGGNPIVETAMNVESLNATTLQASSAAIQSILTSALDAGKITAADALIASATIPALYATSIRAIGEGIELVSGAKSRVWRSETAPEAANDGDLWVQPSTGFMHQRTDSGWTRVQDSELAGQIRLRVESSLFEETADELRTGVSTLTQRADRFELSLEEKVDSAVLKTYLRYSGGAVELGRTGSRYRTRTSDEGFMVLQDGEPMISMAKNAISAPVIESKRQFALGDHGIRLGADGGLLFI